MNKLKADVFWNGFLKTAEEHGVDMNVLQGGLSEYQKIANELTGMINVLEKQVPGTRVKLANQFLVQFKPTMTKEAEGFMDTLKSGFGGASNGLADMMGMSSQTAGGLLGGGGGLLAGLVLSKLFNLPPMAGILLSSLLAGGGGLMGSKQMGGAAPGPQPVPGEQDEAAAMLQGQENPMASQARPDMEAALRTAGQQQAPPAITSIPATQTTIQKGNANTSTNNLSIQPPPGTSNPPPITPGKPINPINNPLDTPGKPAVDVTQKINPGQDQTRPPGQPNAPVGAGFNKTLDVPPAQPGQSNIGAGFKAQETARKQMLTR